MQQQHGQHGTRLQASRSHETAATADLQRTEDPELHRLTLLRRSTLTENVPYGLTPARRAEVPARRTACQAATTDASSTKKLAPPRDVARTMNAFPGDPALGASRWTYVP